MGAAKAAMVVRYLAGALAESRHHGEAQLFRVYRDAGLLKPSDPKLQRYWVARRNETVELTPRGQEYWWLLVNDKI